MSAPYTVVIDHYGDHQSFPCARFSVALTVAKLANRDHPGRVHVHGDGAEGEYHPDGARTWNDGLSESEREMVQEALGL